MSGDFLLLGGTVLVLGGVLAAVCGKGRTSWARGCFLGGMGLAEMCAAMGKSAQLDAAAAILAAAAVLVGTAGLAARRGGPEENGGGRG